MRRGVVFFRELRAGTLEETEHGYCFVYDAGYVQHPEAQPVSVHFPLQEEPFSTQTFFPFFDGLIPEGWLLTLVERNWKLNVRDRMGLLLTTCSDCIGAVRVLPDTDSEASS
ncbi:HipA N-terminal domain-containing protein [Spirochaeta dissipatitropha]